MFNANSCDEKESGSVEEAMVTAMKVRLPSVEDWSFRATL